ncbi:MAG TPA: glycine--tRNA ligase subunit beta [Anaerolineae bacterium]|nr:glycine--tRNA ligase subunit beta [Anaerolineae bacterium]
MSEKLDFQAMILRLIDYWRQQGCLVAQPYNVQVGAGTMNPATALRVLGPEPWSVVYVEPSIRPDDGRYGDNPNRMQQHFQLQVILKPDTGNPQEQYLASLAAIGIDAREHDIRFVEDNWESPALGAWGLGWEVWLDGQEITQFTYFQQTGSLNLDPVAVEITYGLDRIALALQDKNAVWDMDYGAGVKYGDLLLQSEIEHCRYYFDVAEVDTILSIYDMYEGEAQRCIEHGLVVPAHDYNLKCSQLFNILDARGAIGVTERANYFRRMRKVARQISELYIAQREELEYPLLAEVSDDAAVVGKEPDVQVAQTEHPQTFLLEIGCEELPAHDLDAALAYLETAVPNFFEEHRLVCDQIDVLGTPRRLVVVAHGMQGMQEDLTSEVKGPPADRAFDEDGNPTKAALGFARSKGINIADLKVIEDEKGGQYVVGTVHEVGRPAAAILAHELPDFIASIKFGKSMRWNGSNVSFSRPLRWFVALFGPDIIPFTYGDVHSDRVSRGLRPYGSPDIVIEEAASYLNVMADNGIVVDRQERRDIVETVSAQLAGEKGGHIPNDPGLVAEITNLIERPTPFVGRFEDRFLALPAEVLVAVMRKHQRYFPVYNEEGQILPYFIAVRNGDDEHLDKVRHGNEQVIRARFADAEFFYNQDKKRELPDFLPDLKTLTFQTDLGSMFDKNERLKKLVPMVGQMLSLADEELDAAVGAAALAKADLASKMVVEMTSLQGIMGGHYARLNGQPEPVAVAIAEQYNAVSRSKAGLALALADRLDSLIGLFAAGLAPKGSNDPFALRRAAIHIIENLTANEVTFDLRAALLAAAELQPVTADDAVVTNVLTFISGRLEVILQDQGYATTTVRAVLAEQEHNPYGAMLAVAALDKAVMLPEWGDLLDNYARCVRITRSEPMHIFDPGLLSEPSAKRLYERLSEAQLANDGTVDGLLNALRILQPAIATFFDDVMVNVEDDAVRINRLALLQLISALPAGLADLGELEGF